FRITALQPKIVAGSFIQVQATAYTWDTFTQYQLLLWKGDQFVLTIQSNIAANTWPATIPFEVPYTLGEGDNYYYQAAAIRPNGAKSEVAMPVGRTQVSVEGPPLKVVTGMTIYQPQPNAKWYSGANYTISYGLSSGSLDGWNVDLYSIDPNSAYFYGKRLRGGLAFTETYFMRIWGWPVGARTTYPISGTSGRFAIIANGTALKDVFNELITILNVDETTIWTKTRQANVAWKVENAILQGVSIDLFHFGEYTGKSATTTRAASASASPLPPTFIRPIALNLPSAATNFTFEVPQNLTTSINYKVRVYGKTLNVGPGADGSNTASSDVTIEIYSEMFTIRDPQETNVFRTPTKTAAGETIRATIPNTAHVTKEPGYLQVLRVAAILMFLGVVGV
ncbi:hypothetical protein HK102_009373, partial [Quaeritorhiza haematococci]